MMKKTSINTLETKRLHYHNVIYFVVMLVSCFFIVSAMCEDEQTTSESETKELTADDILAKSQEAMSQPLHYKMTTNGVEMSVYQKMLPDGKLALLMDMTQPIKKTTILYGNQSYDVFLEEQTAIDTGFMLKNVQTQAAAIFGANPGIKKNIKKKATLLRITGFHNRDCYDIETVLLPESFETVLKSLPPNMKQYFPVKERLMIDKQTYLIQKKNHFLQMVILLQKLNFKKSHINRR